MGATTSSQKQKLLLMLFTRPVHATPNIRSFRFNIPWIAKITQRTHSTEAHALRFLESSGLDILRPSLILSFVHEGTTYTVMTYITGVRMMEAVADGLLTFNDIQTIASEVSNVLDKLETLRQPNCNVGKVMMSTSGHDLPDPVHFFEERAGPFPSILDLWAHCASYFDVEQMREEVDDATLTTMTADSIRYVHPDLRMYNIIVRDGHLAGIIDWEDSGWYPYSWQVHAMRWPRFGCNGLFLQY
ncbi:hypothetical protein K435DRAFT_800948 [Dendrothele bispora CBS 962.96]|uniref:Aminoglycoside phosphotransferase domain-containing protein n=1 Tax=Dendrothele bispora (strain CBS 962.96) TaxID=1314807 RepID=A0A4S8LS82_DENBC|nr:hypothetical protein K435DRAFT_800948 [Dendrothele bispora CBS 962.96]